MKKIEKMYKFSFQNTLTEFNQELVPILKFLDDKKMSKQLKEILKKYFILRSITLIEEFFKNTIAEYIDNFQFETKGLFKNDELTIPISHLHLLKKRR